MNNKILMILPLLISSPNCLIEVEEPTNVTSDFAQLANFSIGTDYSFLSSKKSCVKFYSENSFVATANVYAAWYKTSNNNLRIFTYVQMEPRRQSFSCILGKCFKQGYSKEVRVTSTLDSKLDIMSPEPVSQQDFTTYELGGSVSETGLAFESSVSVTKGQLQIIGNHSISDKKYDADYIYKGSKDTTYRKTYSEQKGTFAILMNGISYFESSVSFTIDFGMYASSSLFTKDLPVPITLKLSYSGSLL